MKNLRDLIEEREDLVNESKGLVAMAEKEDREFTNEEQAHFADVVENLIPALDEKIEVQQKFNDHIKQEAARKLGAYLPNPGGRDVSRIPTMKDSAGNDVYCLSPEHKLADIYTPEANQCANFVGEVIAAKVRGVKSWTPDSVQNAMSTTGGSGGAFTLTEQMMSDFYDLQRSYMPLSDAGMRTIPMDGAELTMAKVVSDPSFETKVENEAFTESTIGIGKFRLKPYTNGSIIVVSRELFEDGVNTAEIVQEVLARSSAQEVSRIGIAGTGSGEPAGLVNASGFTEVGSIGALAYEDLLNLAKQVRTNNHEPSNSLISVASHEELRALTTGDGTNSAKDWLPTPEGVPSLLSSTAVPTANAIVGDFSKWIYGLRQGALIEVSMDAGDAFEKHQVKIKLTQRFDFGSLDDSAFARGTGITVS